MLIEKTVLLAAYSGMACSSAQIHSEPTPQASFTLLCLQIAPAMADGQLPAQLAQVGLPCLRYAACYKEVPQGRAQKGRQESVVTCVDVIAEVKRGDAAAAAGRAQLSLAQVLDAQLLGLDEAE